MISKQLANNEETPTWDQIRCALGSLFSRFDLDLSNIASTSGHRLQYEDFQLIFYHLFLIIDKETKRKFSSTFPARNQEERSKFIELSVRTINDRKLSTQKVSASQLRMCGGEPFRRLVANLILVAIDKELDTMKRLTPDCKDLMLDRSDSNSSQDLNISSYRNELVQKQHKLETQVRQTRELMEHLRVIRSKSSEIKQLHEEKWKCIAAKFEMGQYSHSLRHVQAICRLLLSRLEEVNGKIKQTSEQIKAIELPREKQQVDVKSAISTNQSSGRKKRLSQYIREARDRLDSSQELSFGADQSRVVSKIRNQLSDYDVGLDKFIEIWKEKADKADEERLKEPEILEKFKLLEQLVPKIDLQLGDLKETKVCLQDIERILGKFPDSKYDDREIIQASRNYFQ